MRQVFDVPVVRQLALDSVPLRNSTSSKNFYEEPMFIFFIVKKDQNYPNKMIDCNGRTFWNCIQGLKVAGFI